MHSRAEVKGLRGFYAIVDPDACRGRDSLDVARAILEGGCAALQLRSKRMSPDARGALGRALRALCADAGVPFYVNDFPELALELGADGLHLGQHDTPIEIARGMLGSGSTIGLSTHGLAQALDAEARGADLVGFGPVFPTSTKEAPDPVVGTTLLAEACARLSTPIVAIGGIDLTNVSQVARAGAPLAAAIGAVCGADDPALAARVIHRTLARGR